jgi:hypothetical protein
LVYTTATGAAVRRSWYDPDDQPVVELELVAESPSGSGKYPYVLQATSPGVWTARVTVSGAATAVEEYFVYARAVPAEKPLAVTGHVVEQYGPLTPAQEGLTGSLLRAASKLVRSRFPRIDAQIAAGLLDPEVAALAVTNMVLRVLRNPGGLRAETIGPFSRSYDTGDAAGLLTISKHEQAMFVPTRSGAGAYAVGSIMMRPGLAPPPTGLCRGW